MCLFCSKKLDLITMLGLFGKCLKLNQVQFDSHFLSLPMKARLIVNWSVFCRWRPLILLVQHSILDFFEYVYKFLCILGTFSIIVLCGLIEILLVLNSGRCPFCKILNYAVEYRGVSTKEEIGIKQIVRLFDITCFIYCSFLFPSKMAGF